MIDMGEVKYEKKKMTLVSGCFFKRSNLVGYQIGLLIAHIPGCVSAL